MTITDIDNKKYTQNVFIIKKAFNTKDELDLLVNVSSKDDVLYKHTYGRKDKDGNLQITYALELSRAVPDHFVENLAKRVREATPGRKAKSDPPPVPKEARS